MHAHKHGFGFTKCEFCGVEFEKRCSNQCFCSDACCNRSYARTKMPRKTEDRKCPSCGNLFATSHSSRRYCSRECQAANSKRAHGVKSLASEYGIPKGNLGALSEMRVCVDLLSRGYYVYRAVAPHGPCDVIAFRSDGPCLRVEVKTSYVLVNGTLKTAAVKPEQKAQPHFHTALVTEAGIFYDPELA